ncbi:MAG: hypothetical protein P8Y13_00195 [Deinococcales bacterium]
MIVPMKRVTVVMLRSQVEPSLALLQDLGVLHLASDTVAEGNGLADARDRVEAAREAAEVLRRVAPAPGETARPAGSADGDAQAVTARVGLLAERLEQIDRERLDIERELKRLAPLGDFDPRRLWGLAERGVGVRLVRAPARWEPELPEDVVLHEVGRERRERIVALVGPVEALARTGLGEGSSAAEELALPERSPAALRKRLAKLTSEREEALASLQALAQHRAAVEASIAVEEDRVAFETARAATALTGPLAMVRGFCPAPKLPSVEDTAARNGWGLFIEDVENPSDAPTEITMPRWVRPIRALFSFTGVLPGYDQVDVSVPFLLFMSLFFAMIVGDAGYGLLFLALTEFGRWRMPNAPRAMFSLLRVMSICTIVWGVLTGTYFGIALLPHPLKAVQVTWLTDQSHMILLSFLIGAVHLTVAHGWNVIRFFPSPRALAQLGWIFSTWTMFFLARSMVLGTGFPHVMLYVLAAGIVLIVLFMTPPKALKSEWFNHVMLPLSLVSNFVDLVSYVRLFAVGAATFAIAQAFNQMAVGSGIGNVVAGAVAALVLFFGHTLNILLATMGVLVHGVRLNMLEFASHLGMEWTGRPYRPFAHTPRQKEGA